MNDNIKTDEKTVDFSTSCLGCVFAKIRGDTQLGCRFHNRVDTYIDKGVTEKVLTEGIEHYVIQTVCNAKRVRDGNRVNYQEKIKTVEKEIAVKTTYIFLCVNMAEVLQYAISTTNKNDKQAAIFVLLGFNPDIKSLLAVNKNYKLIVPVDKSNVMQALDDAVKLVNTTFYTVWDRSESNEKHVEALNTLINEDLTYVLCYQTEKNSYNGLSVNTLVHRMFHGNVNMPIFEKVKMAAEYQGNTEAYYLCESQR